MRTPSPSIINQITRLLSANYPEEGYLAEQTRNPNYPPGFYRTRPGMKQRRAGRVFEARRLSLRRASKTRPALQAIDFNRVQHNPAARKTLPSRQGVHYARLG